MNSDRNAIAVFIDLDGVLRHWPDNARTLEIKHGLRCGSIESVAFSRQFLGPAIRGQIQDHEWRKLVTLELGKYYPDADTESVVAQWSTSSGEVDTDVRELITTCRNKATIVLATNATSRLPDDLRALGIDGHFDFIVNSSDIGHVKPDAEFYRRALEIAGACAERAVFIDDTLKNVEQASVQGLRGHHYSNIKELKAFMLAHGLH